eukprot:scaffold14055_cov114-Isochrysis_galbana.AAC.3
MPFTPVTSTAHGRPSAPRPAAAAAAASHPPSASTTSNRPRKSAVDGPTRRPSAAALAWVRSHSLCGRWAHSATHWPYSAHHGRSPTMLIALFTAEPTSPAVNGTCRAAAAVMAAANASVPSSSPSPASIRAPCRPGARTAVSISPQPSAPGNSSASIRGKRRRRGASRGLWGRWGYAIDRLSIRTRTLEKTIRNAERLEYEAARTPTKLQNYARARRCSALQI